MVNLRASGAALGVLWVLAAPGCATNGEPNLLDRHYTFPNADRIHFLTSFGSEDDVNPPSAFRRWIIGRDAYSAGKGPSRPYGIAVTKGKVYIDDGRDSSGYWVFDLASKEFTVMRSHWLTGSTGIAVDERGYKYLVAPRLAEAKASGTIGTEKEEGAIAVFDEQDRLLKGAKFPGRPIDVAVWRDRLFVTDLVRHRVVILDKETLRPVGEFGEPGNGDEQFAYPKGIAASQDGRIFVGDTFNGSIKVFSTDGELISRYGRRSKILRGFVFLSGLAVDREGRVYAVDSGYIQKFERDEVQIFDSAQFYDKGEVEPTSKEDADKAKDPLLGYFQKPYALGDPDDPERVRLSMYKPVGIAIDYENVSYYQHLAPAGVRLEYLIWLTSEFASGSRNISVFGYAPPQ